MTRFLLVGLGLVSICTACGGSSGSSIGTGTTGTQPLFDLTGSWSGTVTSVTGFRGTFDADLEESGSAVTGAMRLSTGCTPGGKLDGSLSGDSLSGTVVAGDVVVTLTATVVSDGQLDGTYVLPAAGACPSDRGSFELLRR